MAQDEKESVRDDKKADAKDGASNEEESKAETGVKAEESAVKAEETAVKAEETAVKAEETAVKAEETGVKAEETGVKVEEPAVKAEEPAAETHEAERSAAEAHVEAKEHTEEAVGVKKTVPAHDVMHADAHGHGGHHKPNRKEYMVIFVVLAVLTALEVGVAQVPGIARGLLTVSLVALAVTKAAFVGLFYMHLKHETSILKLTVAIPLSAPALYAFVLIADAAWRLAR